MIPRRFFHYLMLPTVLLLYPVLLLIFVYKDVFISQNAIFTHDTIHWYGNFNYFLLSLAKGSLPLWDPYSYSGAPFYLNHNIVGALDPTVLLSIPFIWFSNVSVLDIYHIHFLTRFIIFYAGAYILFRYITKDKWSALIGATVILFVLFPNSCWQHGSTLIVSYVPLIMLFFLQLIELGSSLKKKRILFLSICYLFGLSFNMYLPSYILIYFSLAIVYLLVSRSLKIRHLSRIISSLGIWYIIAGLLIFLIMIGPFVCSMDKVLHKTGENFSYARFQEPPVSDVLVHKMRVDIAEFRYEQHLSFHNLVSILLPGPDIGFFTWGSKASESFLIIGLILLIIVFLFLKRATSPHKGLFLFLLFVIGLYIYVPSNSWYNKILKYYPWARTIRQFHNFQGFYILSLGALVAICFSSVINLIRRTKERFFFLLVWMSFVAVIHGIILYLYFLLLQQGDVSEFSLIKQKSITSYLWVFIVSYLLILLFLVIRLRRIRFCIILAIAGLALYQLIEFNIRIKRCVIQPGQIVYSGNIHYNREFIYNPIRVPFVPRHSTFWGFLPALYRVPAAIPPYVNDYMTLSRRTYDYIRFVSAERQKIISGIGTRRFGFFDIYTVAKDSVRALSLVGGMPIEMLHDVLVLEEDPVEIIPETEALEYVDIDSIDISSDLVRGSHQQRSDFYDRIAQIDYKDSNVYRSDGYLKVGLSSGHPGLDWPWDMEHIGYFQILVGFPHAESLYYKPFFYFPGPGIRTGYKGSNICYVDFQEWLVKHVIPGFYNSIYDQVLYPCDLERIGDELVISPELQGAFVTDDIGGLIKDSEIPGITIMSLDPKRVTPDRSPYSRDELTEVFDFSPNKISFRVKNTRPGLFYYADSYAKDWEAMMDGKSSHIFKADFNYKAVFVPKGEHIITFKFNPKIYGFLMWVFIIFSIPGMALPVIALVWSKFK